MNDQCPYTIQPFICKKFDCGKCHKYQEILSRLAPLVKISSEVQDDRFDNNPKSQMQPLSV